MKTLILKVDAGHFDPGDLLPASELLRAGELVAFPTETVYGLGADGMNEDAVEKIFEVKGRPADNPLILHIANESMLKDIAVDIPPLAKLLMKHFWPGAITFVLKASPIVPRVVTAGLDTVAVRMPDNPIALTLIEQAGVPVAAPSANLSGRPSPTRARDVEADLADLIPMIIDGGDTNIGIESTVLDVTGECPVILRPGKVTPEELREYDPRILCPTAEQFAPDVEMPRSPGMKYRHYAPKGELLLFSGEDMCAQIVSEIHRYKQSGKRVGVLCTAENYSNYRADLVYNLGSAEDLDEVARNIFAALREMDHFQVDVILAESVKEEKMGYAVMNRLLKASGGKRVIIK